MATHGTFRKNLEDGFFKAWHENGTLIYEGRYSAGKKQGLHRTWSPDGVIDKEVEWRNGAPVTY